MTRAELLRRISSAELTEWIAFDQIDPIGDERADLNAGIVASTLANCNRGEATEPFKPADFMPDYDGSRREEEPDVDALMAKFQAVLPPKGEE